MVAPRAAAVGLESGWAIYLYDRFLGTYTGNFPIGDRYPAILCLSADGPRIASGALHTLVQDSA
jgi:hypothetical protein